VNEMGNVCLNCNEKLRGNYCIHCGQSAATDRFTLKHIFTRDLIRVIFYIHGGFFYTVKELFTRPGHSIREYISGKRVKHLNYLTLLVILLIGFSLLEQVTSFHFSDLAGESNELLESLDVILKKNSKTLYIGLIPFYALFSLLIFRKAKQNYAEHFVLNSFRVATIVILNILFISFASFVKDISILRKANTVLFWIGAGYGTFFYFQYFSPFYRNKFLLFLQSLICSLLPGLILALGFITYFTLKSS